MADLRDNHGMTERAEDDWVMRVEIQADDAMAVHQNSKLDLIHSLLVDIKAKLDVGINVKVVTTL